MPELEPDPKAELWSTLIPTSGIHDVGGRGSRRSVPPTCDLLAADRQVMHVTVTFLYKHFTRSQFVSTTLIPRPAAAMPEVQDFPQTKEALKMNLTLRCLIRTKYRDGKSRRSAAVISWAQTSLKNLTGAAIRKVGKETAGFSIELIMIQVLDSRSVIHICYDVFLDECDPGLRNEISVKFHAKHPIHLITGKGKSFLMRRDERMDTKVFEQYLQMSSKDKGP